MTPPSTVVPVVELASIFILAAFVLAQPRAQRVSMLFNAAWIGVGAVLGEETCIAFYKTYAYAPQWSLKVHEVPVMVGCIWPAVVLSARQVVFALVPEGRARTWGVAGLVFFDATLVEAVSVRAGLWAWDEGAVLGVPLIGLVGWAAYSAWASVAIERGWHPLLRVTVPPLLTHGALLCTWWGALRWGLREPFSAGVLCAASCVAALFLTAALWSRRGTLPLSLMGPRALAAGLFFVLVALTAGDGWGLVLFTAPFSVPYLVATRWRTQSLTEGASGERLPSGRP